MFKRNQTNYSIEVIGLVWKEEMEEDHLTGEEKE